MNNNYLLKLKIIFGRQPLAQAFIIVFLGILLLFFNWLTVLTGLIEPTKNFAWEVLAMGIFLYALFNNILSLSSENPTRYWTYSLIGFVLLFLLLGGLAYLITGVFILDLDIFKNILFVLSIGYLIIASIVRLMRFLMEWAKQQDELREQK